MIVKWKENSIITGGAVGEGERGVALDNQVI